VLDAAAAGLMTGALYALLASGFALVLSVARTFNLAHGELIVLGAYIGEYLWRTAGLSPLAAMPLAALPCGALVLASRPLLRRLGEPFVLRALVLTFGLSLVLQGALQDAFSADLRMIVVPAWEEGIQLLGVRLPAGRLIVALVSVGLLLALYLVWTRTFFGKSLRAVSQDREAACLAGISPRRVDGIVLLLGGLLAGASGPLFAAVHSISPAVGLGPVTLAIVLTILAGIGRIGGLLVGGLLLGLAEALAGWFGGAMWHDLIPLGLLVGLLRWRAGRLVSGANRT
jgi:branched-chain amino acid transport system permease protein